MVCNVNNDTIYSVAYFAAFSIQRGEIYMKIIKRSGSEDVFDAAKIVAAISKVWFIKLFIVFVVVSLPIAAVLSAITQVIKNKDVKKNEWRNILEIINL